MTATRRDNSRKPGAGFASRPCNTLALPTPTDKRSRDSPTSAAYEKLARVAAMVKERAPPKGSSSLQPAAGAGAGAGDATTADPPRGTPSQRDASPDDDLDITAVVRDFSSIKSKYRPDAATSGSSGSSVPATAHPTFGHPTKMVSSLKQKADIFIHQKTRPEHHLDNRVVGPRAPTYQNKRAPPMPTFNSNTYAGRSSYDSAPSRDADAVFYTDPAKANADLKALLEGGLDDEEGADDGDKPPVEPNTDKLPEAAVPQVKAESKTDSIIGKDGRVDGLKVRLLPHQVEGVNWMYGRELGPVKRGTVPKGGLLADDMGLGKTLQTVSLMMKNQKPSSGEKRWKKHFQGLERTTLVVAPLALIRQWEHELRDKVDRSHGLKVLVHHGPQRTKNSEDLAKYDVVITTYQILVSEHGSSSDGKGVGCFGLHWWRVVLDEAHNVKNRNAKATKACYALRSEYRWCLSGTPMQNNLDELQSLVRFLRIKPYDDLKQWKEHIELPLRNGKGHIAIRRLHSILRCFMKRRTKEILKEKGALFPGGEAPATDDATAVTTDFRHTERKVVTVSTKLTPAERNFYSRLEQRADKSLEAMMHQKMSYASAFTLLLRLRQACNHPKLLEGKIDLDKDALSTGASSQKKQDADVDSMADMFSGMGIQSKRCAICGRSLAGVDLEVGRDNCTECQDDLKAFQQNDHTNKEKKKKKRKKEKHNRKKKASSSKAKANHHASSTTAKRAEDDEAETDGPVDGTKSQRRQRNRRAVIDSDDEEDAEGSWLVPEGERGDLHLGKAGGEEDENAEGGGDWIGPEDSDDSSAGDGDESRLSSFVVDDGADSDRSRCESVDEKAADEDDDSLLSVSAITKKMAAHTLDPSTKSESSSAHRKFPRSEHDASDSETKDSEDSDSSSSDLSSSSSSSSESSDAEDLGTSTETPLFPSSKITEIMRLLRAEANEHKFIVFSQFTSMLDLIEPFLLQQRQATRRGEGARLGFRRYDGAMRNDEREESLRRLREDASVRVLLCSLKCGSLGLNLTAATRVIIVEPFWNPFVEEQAIDRVHRLNQTVDVTVYKLTVSDTVEERIIDLQEKKRLLAEQTIEGGAKKRAVNLGLKEIIDLFRPGGHFHDDHAAEYGDDFAAAAGGGGGAKQDEQRRARQAANFIRNRNGGSTGTTGTRQESSVYGRRW